MTGRSIGTDNNCQSFVMRNLYVKNRESESENLS